MRPLRLLAVLLLAALTLGHAVASDAEIAAIEATLKPGPVDTALFSPAFLRAVPPEQLQATLGNIGAQIGPVVAIEPRGATSYLVRTATHELPAEITLDAAGRIVGLLFRAAVARDISIEQILADMRDIAPSFSILVTKDGNPLHAVDPDQPLAVGSAFKLGVLQALNDEIETGARDWSSVVRLSAGDLSLPSGTLHTWPVGSPLTLHTLAAMMISISDNTATDTLIHLLGRERVEAVLGIAPVLTTRELFTLKAEPELRNAYLEGNLAEKRRVLEGLEGAPLPDLGKVNTHYDPGMEWNLSATALCALMESVAGLEVMTINPGVASRFDWDRIAYKGGSELGVLNFTTAAIGKNGARYCIAATWNGPEPIDETKAAPAYASLLAVLSRS